MHQSINTIKSVFLYPKVLIMEGCPIIITVFPKKTTISSLAKLDNTISCDIIGQLKYKKAQFPDNLLGVS